MKNIKKIVLLAMLIMMGSFFLGSYNVSAMSEEIVENSNATIENRNNPNESEYNKKELEERIDGKNVNNAKGSTTPEGAKGDNMTTSSVTVIITCTYKYNSRYEKNIEFTIRKN